VAFIHAHGYTHTDLKPENILLCTNELEKKSQTKAESIVLPVDERVKLIDFGGATHNSERHSSVINTRQYRSPEVILQCCEWKESSDVWSIGCIIPELYTGNLLFPTHDDLEHLLMIIKNSK
jgi:serine/threonine protein kinase